MLIGPDYVDKITQARVAAALRDLRDVLCCQDHIQGTRTLRFIKYKGDGPTRAKSVKAEKGTVSTRSSRRRKEINSTKLREAIRTKNGTELKASLDQMALSPEVLWWYAPIWLKKARMGYGNGITFLSSHSLETEPQSVVDPKSRAVVPKSKAVVPKLRDVIPKSRKRPLSVAFPEEDTTPAPPARKRRAASI